MSATTFTIIHFNDVYNVTEGENEPVGGISRFVSAIRSFQDRNPLILFSGDALNPSFLSQTTKGKHMITALNQIGVHCAVYGNHDFDFGVDTLLERAAESNFPWLLSNCTDNTTCEPLANGKIYEIIEWEGLRIGLIGLIEEEWVATLAAVDADLITVTDFITEGNELGRMLKTEKNCDLVIALTHSRWPNDVKLANECDPDLIDLILGGHDHDYNVHTLERRTADGRFRKLTALKSGADFRDFSVLTVRVEEVEVETRLFGKLSATPSELELESQTCSVPRKFIGDLQIERVQVTRQFPEEPVSAASVRAFVEQREAELNVVLGEVDVDLDARFSEVRTRETNVGNFICDVMLKAVEAHAAVLNGGDLRADCIFQKGEFRVKHLETLLPTPDPIVVLRLTGRHLLQALENGVSQVPKMEGRFPQVGGIRFGYDPDRPSGSRIDPSWVTVQDERLDLDREYKVCTTEYLSLGKDGYEVFKTAPRIGGPADDGPRLPNILRNHFHSCNVLEGKTRPRSVHRQCTLSLVQKRTIECQLDDDGVEMFTQTTPLDGVKLIGMQEEETRKAEPTSPSGAWKTRISPVRKHLRSLFALSRTRSIVRQKSVEDVERQAKNGRIAPVVDGRIYIVHSEEPSLDPTPPAEPSEQAGPRKTGIPKQRSLVKQQQVDE